MIPRRDKNEYVLHAVRSTLRKTEHAEGDIGCGGRATRVELDLFNKAPPQGSDSGPAVIRKKNGEGKTRAEGQEWESAWLA